MQGEQRQVDRRGLFQLGAQRARQWVADAARAAADGVARRSSGGKRYLRPPGALPEPAFLLACERCDKCAEACPEAAIRILPAAAGAAAGTPYIDPLQAPCRLCLECVQACPSGALTGVTVPQQVRMGLAELMPDACWAHQGSICSVCYDQCPFPDAAIRMEHGRPIIIPSACTGCGICAYVCVSTPGSIRIKPLEQ